MTGVVSGVFGIYCALAHISCVKVDGIKNLRLSGVVEWSCKHCGQKASSAGSVASASSNSNKLTKDIIVREVRAVKKVIYEELTELRTATRELEPCSRRNIIEYSGLPMIDVENMEVVVRDLSAALGRRFSLQTLLPHITYPLSKRPRTVHHRAVQQSCQEGPVNCDNQEEWLTGKEINPAFPSTRVFVNSYCLCRSAHRRNIAL
ncbi:hypothetical protein J6590_038164 [Homalodisca vitripennis]|nr:hypothetical protein J6590_038164 [Homalodisca vitripennis]